MIQNSGLMPIQCPCDLRLSMALKFLASLLERLRRMYETYLQMQKLSKSHGVIYLKLINPLLSIFTGESPSLSFKQLEYANYFLRRT